MQNAANDTNYRALEAQRYKALPPGLNLGLWPVTLMGGTAVFVAGVDPDKQVSPYPTKYNADFENRIAEFGPDFSLAFYAVHDALYVNGPFHTPESLGKAPDALAAETLDGIYAGHMARCRFGGARDDETLRDQETAVHRFAGDDNRLYTLGLARVRPGAKRSFACYIDPEKPEAMVEVSKWLDFGLYIPTQRHLVRVFKEASVKSKKTGRTRTVTEFELTDAQGKTYGFNDVMCFCRHAPNLEGAVFVVGTSIN